ncbi:uncharacterized protein LOC142243939 [Anomaloglossus baeobatrachus]|uniref:uncharacterized protein LOC142243939 n=1 Tax=Anomaloglossus baeobatrachus TaxID=238106 RepID=UPI003F5059D4
MFIAIRVVDTHLRERSTKARVPKGIPEVEVPVVEEDDIMQVGGLSSRVQRCSVHCGTGACFYYLPIFLTELYIFLAVLPIFLAELPIFLAELSIFLADLPIFLTDLHIFLAVLPIFWQNFLLWCSTNRVVVVCGFAEYDKISRLTYKDNQIKISCQELKSLIRPTGRTAKFTCGVDGTSVLQQGLHWYHQDSNKVIKWLLFYKPGKPDEAVQEYKTRTSLEIVTESSCTLSITNIRPTDDGTYFCAAWHKDANMKKFGAGTKLLVIDQAAVKPDVTILATSKEVVKDTGFATLLCNLQNFFPDMINVMWTVDGRDGELHSEQGELVKNESSQMSSFYSWITITKSDIGKIYKCRYKHEGNVAMRDLWQEVTYDTAILKDTNQDEPKNANCSNSAGDVEASTMVIRAAQLTYMLLLLKCFVYFPFLLVLKYKFGK